jgi:hypothetical protein
MAGGIKGCTHLVELIMAMAPAALQGFFVHQLQKSSAFNPDQAKMFAQSLINTCCAWREDVPFVEMSKKKLNMK